MNTICLLAQSNIEWSPEYQLQSSDFKSAATEIGGNNLSIFPASKFDFSFQMSQYEFMFTKNFNSKVVTSFYPQSAYYTAPDSLTAKDLLEYARLTFDLTELYARKFRQQCICKKEGFRTPVFFNPFIMKLKKNFPFGFPN